MNSSNLPFHHRDSIYLYPTCQSPFNPKDTKSEGSKISLSNGFFTVDRVYTENIIAIIFGSPIWSSYIYRKEIMFILYYLLIGIIIMFLLDMHLLAYTKKIEFELKEKIEYDLFTRIFIIVVWPAALFIIIKNLM